MKLRLLLRPEAEVDVSNAYQWYEEQLKGLGRKFLSSVEKSLHAIQTNPARFPVVHRNIRRSLPQHFPYAIFFIREEEAVVVIAVLHQARDPRRWKVRYV